MSSATLSPVVAETGPRSSHPVLITTTISLIAILVNFPFIAALLVSFKIPASMRQPLAMPFGSNATLAHYRDVLYAAGYDFPLFFRNSLVISSSTVVLVLALALPAAYAIVRLNLGGRWLLNAVAGLRLLPAIFFILPLFVMMSNLGLLDTIWAMIIVDTFLNIPIAMVLLSRGIAEVPIDLEEAANVDGASPFRILRSIVTPLMTPTLVATGVITFLFTWNDFLFAVIMTTSRARPVTVGATQFVTSFGIDWGPISAITVLSLAFPILFAVSAQRYLVSGLATGAIGK